MNKRIDEAIARLEKDGEERVKTSLYLSKALYKAFKKEVGKAPAGKALEALIRDFLRNRGHDV